MYSGLEAGEIVCMNSDSEGDDVDLTGGTRRYFLPHNVVTAQ